ncbi:MAG: anthrone oxygenase family protein [Chitinophagaceae bacterium]
MANAYLIIQFISLVLLMLVTGIFWGTWFSLSRSIERISPESFLENGQIFIKNLAVPMRILMPLTILFIIVSTVFYPYKVSTGFYLTLISLVLIIITLLITLLVEVPIDNQIKNWTIETLPADWESLRSKWQSFHTIRTFTSIGSFVLLLAGILFK